MDLAWAALEAEQTYLVEAPTGTGKTIAYLVPSVVIASQNGQRVEDPRQTVGSVARAVGYSSPYALSAAFKRVRGTSPHRHRTAQRLPVTSADQVPG